MRARLFSACIAATLGMAVPAAVGQNPLDARPAVPPGNPLDVGNRAPAGNPLDTGAVAAVVPLRRVGQSATHGEALAAVADAAPGATALARATAAQIGAAFARPVDLSRAVVDDVDQNVEALFTAQRGEAPVLGRMSVRVVGGRAAVTVAYHDALSDPQVLADLFRQANAALPEDLRPAPGAPAEIKLYDARLTDGTGTIRLPEGYRVADAYQGKVHVVGPDDTVVFLGHHEIVYTERGTITALGTRLEPGGGIVVFDPCPPHEAVVRMARLKSEYARKVNPQAPWTEVERVVEAMPLEWQGGQAEMVLVDLATRTADGKASRQRALALVAVLPVDETQWVYYTSFVAAPAEAFAKRLPEMLAAWGNWKVDQKTLLDRLTKANESMKETTKIIQDVNAQRQKAGSKAAAAFDGYIVGSSPVVDPQTGQVKHIDNRQIDDELKKLNQEAGYQKWKTLDQANAGANLGG